MRKENLKKCSGFEEQKGTSNIRENVYFGIMIFSCHSSKKAVSQISFKLFGSGGKRRWSEFLKKWGWFQGLNERFPKYLGKKLRFQETETGFCRWKRTDNNDNIFLSLESSYTCLLAKENTLKRIFNTNIDFFKKLRFTPC